MVLAAFDCLQNGAGSEKKRFSNLTSQEIDQMVASKDSENTKKATTTAVATLIEFCRETKRETVNIIFTIKYYLFVKLEMTASQRV